MKKFLTVILLLALAVLALVNYQKRMQLANELKTLSVRMEQLQTGNDPQNIEKANQIIQRVKRHMVISGDVQPTVATIVDVDALKSRNDFYKNATNGDHLIVTPTRAILYDPVRDVIIDVAPVQIQAPALASASSQPAVK